MHTIVPTNDPGVNIAPHALFFPVPLPSEVCLVEKAGGAPCGDGNGFGPLGDGGEATAATGFFSHNTLFTTGIAPALPLTTNH